MGWREQRERGFGRRPARRAFRSHEKALQDAIGRLPYRSKSKPFEVAVAIGHRPLSRSGRCPSTSKEWRTGHLYLQRHMSLKERTRESDGLALTHTGR